ncbi:MAG: histidine kinase, partial [Chloroflexales bacterium]|nr:histidine kinase [Chloroflexales bacterium]
GVPLVISKPTHQMARDIMGLARELSSTSGVAAAKTAGAPAATAETASKQGGLFSRIIKR